MLDAHASGNSIPRHLARAYAEIVRRILCPPESPHTDAQRREFAAALAYEIRLNLYGPGTSAGALKETAEQHGYAESSVKKFVTRWQKQTAWHLERLGNNCEYDGLERGAILQRELAELEQKDNSGTKPSPK